MVNELVKELREAVRRERRIYVSDRYLYLVNADTIGKGHSEAAYAHNEYSMGTYVFENGVNVPKFYQLVRPDCILSVPFRSSSLRMWFILMQRINGIRLRDLSDTREKEYVMKQFRTEITKVLELGIYPWDSINSGNILFDRDQEKTYLVDFSDWKIGTAEEIDSFYRDLKNFMDSLP